LHKTASFERLSQSSYWGYPLDPTGSCQTLQNVSISKKLSGLSTECLYIPNAWRLPHGHHLLQMKPSYRCKLQPCSNCAAIFLKSILTSMLRLHHRPQVIPSIFTARCTYAHPRHAVSRSAGAAKTRNPGLISFLQKRRRPQRSLLLDDNQPTAFTRAIGCVRP